MPSFCAVATCNDRYGHSENISFHKFPLKRSNLLKQWEAFIQKQRGADWHASRWSSLCSRHFREEDFRSLNERRTLKKTAVPSILGVPATEEKCKSKKPTKVIESCENTREKEFKEILAIKERLEDTALVTSAPVALNVPKANCRLCGIASVPKANFLTNYELYGLLQKCFPTLNFQQEDTLPKVMCAPCHKSLEEFGAFVDRVWTAQTDLQRKFRTKAVEKPVKIKQEPLVRVKQEVAECGYEERQDTNGFGGTNEDYDAALEGGGHEEGDDQKFEFCDFPIINDCDIMEIINLDDPFINIPDDDNTTTVNEEEEILQKPIQEAAMNYMPSAHELLQSHLLMEEHNYAYIDADTEFKEERQIYKTEKSDNDERLVEYVTGNNQPQQQQQTSTLPAVYTNEARLNTEHLLNESYNLETTTAFEKRALKPIVTSVSAIQQPTKPSSNGIVVLNESIVKSGCGFQLHACMVCQLKFFSVESLKQHYTQHHSAPMVTVPNENIPLQKNPQNTCKMEKECQETNTENCPEMVANKTQVTDGNKDFNNEKAENETKKETPDNFVENQEPENQNPCPNDIQETTINDEIQQTSQNSNKKLNEMLVNIKTRKAKLKIPLKSRKSQNVSLNAMANQYQQLRKLYQKLQKKCTNLEQNVEQLQLLPTATNKKINKKLKALNTQKISKTINSSKLKTTETLENKKVSFTCAVCSKSFSNANSLRQHKITHTEERKHHCSLCQRTFKRRNGLLQHLKGFHLQVKPFCCPVCKHSYALKCDMLRCKHSTLRNLHSSCETSNANRGRLVLKNLEK
ncbi:cell wall transcription factor ACE2 [Lucilia cuprina]|uniref:cell wall transcription factor ACE2 n=1 Tax=Lucilia cuprina TaxID=7375 RepID=UPI001F05EA35|nr:cell wall transcription factor ACE2 [Lucilia cuprina]